MRTLGVAAAVALAISTGSVAVAASPSPVNLSAADCVRAWNGAPVAPSIKALRGAHRARIQVFNSRKYQSDCIVSVLRAGTKGIIVVGARRGVTPIRWRTPTVAQDLTSANVRINALVSASGLLALR
ncbi:MAG TPA: hypothetical protein VGO31_01155 [Microbacteriaceae bacterium]|jgi:hypothetical protein|nr:hypothetical protein [Microbacteriaceae bacterium]